METVKRHLEAAKVEYEIWTEASKLTGDDLHPLGRNIYAAIAALPGPRKMVWTYHGNGLWRAGQFHVRYIDEVEPYFRIYQDKPGHGAPIISDHPSCAEAKAACQQLADASADPLADLRGRLQNESASFVGHIDRYQQGRRDAFKDILTILDATQ